MKPKEFDELIRQKFDQDDFAYNPRNWDQLAEQMDGRARKRSAMMWWLMPIAGIAASVAMAMGVTNILRQTEIGQSGASTAFVQSGNFEKPQILQNEPATTLVATAETYTEPNNAPTNNQSQNTKKNKTTAAATKFAISYENAVGFTPSKKQGFVMKDIMIPKKEKKEVAVASEGYNTFKPQDDQPVKPAKTSIILSGGVNRGNQNSGYIVGATVRRMISDKVFIESDVAFASSNNTQSKEVFVPTGTTGSATARVAARGTVTEDNKTTLIPAPQGKNVNQSESYNLYYAQVSPSIGYKVMKKMSVGVGPDFQQALADNRPATNENVSRNNIAVAPLFDVGFIGKTEYSVTKKVKAGVLYRKGINNILTPMDKYIDRDYLQFQLKCTIFNK